MQEKLEIKVFFFFCVNTHCTATPATVRINVCLIKIRSKHSSNTLLSLLRFFYETDVRKKLSKQPWDEKNVLFTIYVNVKKVI